LQPQFLIRKLENQAFSIRGPYSLKQVQNLIQQNSFHLMDEICLHNNYWVSFYEVHELEKILELKEETLRKIFYPEPKTQEDVTKPDIKTKNIPILIFEKSKLWNLLFIIGVLLCVFGFLWVLKSLSF